MLPHEVLYKQGKLLNNVFTLLLAYTSRHLQDFYKAVHIIYTWCDNLIPGIVAACRWGIETGKLVYSNTYGHVPTCVYISHRPNESFVPEQQRK